MVYDQAPLKSLDEPSVRMLDDYNRKMSLAAQPGAYLVEVVPMLDRLPDLLSPWRMNAKEAFQECSSMLLGKYRSVDERRASSLRVSALLNPNDDPSFPVNKDPVFVQNYSKQDHVEVI
jgi:hypothetical protein